MCLTSSQCCYNADRQKLSYVETKQRRRKSLRKPHSPQLESQKRKPVYIGSSLST